MTIRRTALATAASALAIALTACNGEADADPIDAAVERCQEVVSTYSKYPGSADWVAVNLAEEQNDIIYIQGEADFNNDDGNPVRTKYHCHLNTETDDWNRPPSMEPKNPAGGERWTSSRWGGAQSPMLEKYGDEMSLEAED